MAAAGSRRQRRLEAEAQRLAERESLVARKEALVRQLLERSLAGPSPRRRRRPRSRTPSNATEQPCCSSDDSRSGDLASAQASIAALTARVAHLQRHAAQSAQEADVCRVKLGAARAELEACRAQPISQPQPHPHAARMQASPSTAPPSRFYFPGSHPEGSSGASSRPCSDAPPSSSDTCWPPGGSVASSEAPCAAETKHKFARGRALYLV